MKSKTLLAAFLAFPLLLAAGPQAQEYVSKEVISAGGGRVSGGGFILEQTVGQTATDEATGGGYSHQSGFWYMPWLIVTDASGGMLPYAFRLYQNYPNPFNPSTTIKFSLSEDSDVSLKVYDVAGRQVRIVVDRHMKAGIHVVPFRPDGLASGVYFFRLKSGHRVETKKMVILR